MGSFLKLTNILIALTFSAGHYPVNKSLVVIDDDTPTIKVVIHIVLPNPYDVSDQDVINQIEEMNKCFGYYNNDPWMRFELNKIVRVKTMASTSYRFNPSPGLPSVNWGIQQVKNNLTRGSSPWDPQKYMNVWVCQISTSKYAGHAYLPWQLRRNGGCIPDMLDGVVIPHDRFSSKHHPLKREWKLLTHEVGHYLGLYHPKQQDNYEASANMQKVSVSMLTGCSWVTINGDQVNDTYDFSESEWDEISKKYQSHSDPNGGCDPNLSNYMIQGLPTHCQTGFTDGQIAMMKKIIGRGGERYFLVNWHRTSTDVPKKPNHVTGRVVGVGKWTGPYSYTGLAKVEWYKNIYQVENEVVLQSHDIIPELLDRNYQVYLREFSPTRAIVNRYRWNDYALEVTGGPNESRFPKPNEIPERYLGQIVEMLPVSLTSQPVRVVWRQDQNYPETIVAFASNLKTYLSKGSRIMIKEIKPDEVSIARGFYRYHVTFDILTP